MTARMSFVAELNLVVDAAGATTRLLFGTEGWAAKPTDTPANTHIAGVLADPGRSRSELEFQWRAPHWPGAAEFGQIVLNNADGALDGMMSYGMGGTVTVRATDRWATPIQRLDDGVHGLRLRAGGGFHGVRVLLRDRLFLLDKPIVTETFAGSAGSADRHRQQEEADGAGAAGPRPAGADRPEPADLLDAGQQRQRPAMAVQRLGRLPRVRRRRALARGAPYTSAEEG